MIARLALLAGLLWLAACSEREAARKDWPAPSPALWEVSDQNGVRAWLFGTIHALPDGVTWRTEQLEAALAESGVLVVEIAELGRADEAAEAFGGLARSGGLPPLLARVPQSERAKVRDLLERAEMTEGDFAEIESWGAALILANAVAPFDNANGVDRALLLEKRMKIGLESYPAQFALFDGLAAEDQAQLLVAVAEETRLDDGEAQVAGWLSGDMAALEDGARDSLLTDPELRETLLDGRNRAWRVRVERLIEAGERPFVAVGAAHMLGEEGLPALLARSGYRVRRIQ